jgi:hypothetical protein
MQTCPACHRSLPEINRYCTSCGQRLVGTAGESRAADPGASRREQLNLNILYGMVAMLALAVVFPPWETPPSHTPEFLGLHFILSPPAPDAIVSRLLLTIELVTITIAGLYGAFLFRRT